MNGTSSLHVIEKKRPKPRFREQIQLPVPERTPDLLQVAREVRKSVACQVGIFSSSPRHLDTAPGGKKSRTLAAGSHFPRSAHEHDDRIGERLAGRGRNDGEVDGEPATVCALRVLERAKCAAPCALGDTG